MFERIFFWRGRRLPQAEAPRPEPELLPVTNPEPISMPEVWRTELNSPRRDSRTLMVVHSNTARALEAQPVEHDDEAKPVLVLSVGPSILPPPPRPAEAKPEPHQDSPTGQPDSDLPQSGRIAYFTHGCYAVASLGSPKLTAPDLIRDAKRRRLPQPRLDQSSTANAKPGNEPERPAAAQK
jgi:hypothetical protein